MAAWVIWGLTHTQPMYRFKARNSLIRCVQVAAKRDSCLHMLICRFFPQMTKMCLLNFGLFFAPIFSRSVIMVFFLLGWSIGLCWQKNVCTFTSNGPSLITDSLQRSVSEPQEVSTRVMIFSSFRESVQEIAGMLNRHTPLIRVMTFMGQASAGKGVKGFTQKEQLEVDGSQWLAASVKPLGRVVNVLRDGKRRPRRRTDITVQSFQGNQINKWVWPFGHSFLCGLLSDGMSVQTDDSLWHLPEMCAHVYIIYLFNSLYYRCCLLLVAST